MKKFNPYYFSKVLLITLLLSLNFGLVSSCGKCDEESGQNCSNYNLEIPGVDGPHITLLGDVVLISVVFENIQLDGGLRYNIPKYPNSYIEISPDLQSYGTLMSISISVDDIFAGGMDQLDPQTLPGGRPLPGVATGRLPAVAFSIEKFRNMAFYLGPKLFGVFIPVKNLNMQGAMLSSRFYSNGKRTGNISLVGEDTNEKNGGFLLMLDMNSQTKKALKYMAKKY